MTGICCLCGAQSQLDPRIKACLDPLACIARHDRALIAANRLPAVASGLSDVLAGLDVTCDRAREGQTEEALAALPILRKAIAHLLAEIVPETP